MSSSDLGAGEPRHVDFTPAGGSPNVRWIRPDTAAYRSPPKSRAASERTEQVNAMFVIVLTFACTAISLYDLLLLAAGA
jgi:hypothetical protein